MRFGVDFAQGDQTSMRHCISCLVAAVVLSVDAAAGAQQTYRNPIIENLEARGSDGYPLRRHLLPLPNARRERL